MIFIDYDFENLDFPEGWVQRASDLSVELTEELCPIRRKAIIERYRDHWSRLRPMLRDLSHGKCWYTESKQDGTDTDVDHFRPKNNVSEEGRENHGYWWLAFDASNYRLSCIVANRRRTDTKTNITGGKGSHFPLCLPEDRARTPQCDLTAELPKLLDPCDEVDVMQITYASNGEAIATYSHENQPRQNSRAMKTIELYNLNHSDFRDARVKLRDTLNVLKSDAERNYKKLETGDAAHKEAFRQAIRNIKAHFKPEQPYSRFCRDYIEPYARTDEHLKGIFS